MPEALSPSLPRRRWVVAHAALGALGGAIIWVIDLPWALGNRSLVLCAALVLLTALAMAPALLAGSMRAGSEFLSLNDWRFYGLYPLSAFLISLLWVAPVHALA